MASQSNYLQFSLTRTLDQKVHVSGGMEAEPFTGADVVVTVNDITYYCQVQNSGGLIPEEKAVVVETIRKIVSMDGYMPIPNRLLDARRQQAATQLEKRRAAAQAQLEELKKKNDEH